EAAVRLVELEGGDTEDHEDPVHSPAGVLGGHPVDVVVDGVDGGEAFAEGREAGTGERDGLGVTVDADVPQLREALQGELAVAAHPEGRVDEYGTGVLHGGGEEVEAACGEH